MQSNSSQTCILVFATSLRSRSQCSAMVWRISRNAVCGISSSCRLQEIRELCGSASASISVPGRPHARPPNAADQFFTRVNPSRRRYATSTVPEHVADPTGAMQRSSMQAAGGWAPIRLVKQLSDQNAHRTTCFGYAFVWACYIYPACFLVCVDA